MANDLNRFECIGRLGQDPDVRYTPSGTNYTRLNVAVNESWKDNSGQTKERTTWIRCIAWGKLGEICAQYLKKGSRLYLAGRLSIRRYERDGEPRYITEIVINDMQMLDPKPDTGGQDTTPQPQAEDHDDDIPF